MERLVRPPHGILLFPGLIAGQSIHNAPLRLFQSVHGGMGAVGASVFYQLCPVPGHLLPNRFAETLMKLGVFKPFFHDFQNGRVPFFRHLISGEEFDDVSGIKGGKFYFDSPHFLCEGVIS